jgi:transcriptional regulator with XRE-family HTH domain
MLKMSKLSVEKLNNLKKQKCLTNKKISELTEVPLVTIDRLFSGRSANPTVTLLQKVAKVLECTVDDFIDYDKDSPLADYYENKETAKLAQEIHDNPEYRMLFDATKNLSPEDLQAVINIANRIKGTKDNG